MGLSDLFGSNEVEQTTEPSGVDELVAALEPNTLSLSVVFGEPQLNTDGQNTAELPFNIFNSGDMYGFDEKEFVIPDDGFDDNSSELVEFVAALVDEAPADTGVGALRAVERTEVPAELSDGDVEVLL